MAYVALYRKYRPQTFSAIVGQEPIVRTLKNQLRSGRISHAYLFCGTRGTGKTSTAKIFAKAINCLSPVDGEPCGQCALCQAMEEGRSVNVLELDAASNNGVDHIREIREEVKYPPTEGKYKVYIIDEVHMLSTGAFNALLKTLEEPPEHVIFILATTDPQKVPATILSRCQRVDFHRISLEQIAMTLADYVRREGAQVERGALRTIAALADGSLRDSLSILDQCLAFYGDGVLTEGQVLEIAGATGRQVFFDLMEAIRTQDTQKTLELVDTVVSSGREITGFVTDFIGHLRALLIAGTVEEGEMLLEVGEEQYASYRKQAAEFSPEELTEDIRRFSALLPDLRLSQTPRVLLEAELITLCTPQEKQDLSAILARLAVLERQVAQGVRVSAPAAASSAEKPKAKQAPKPLSKALPQELQQVVSQWDEILAGLNISARSLFQKCEPVFLGDGRLTLVCSNIATENIMEKRTSQLETEIAEKTGKTVDVRLMTQQAWEEWNLTHGLGEESNDENTTVKEVLELFPDTEVQE